MIVTGTPSDYYFQYRAVLAITPPVIRQTRSVFMLALDTPKVAVLEEAQRATEDIDTLSGRMVLGPTSLLDNETNIWKND